MNYKLIRNAALSFVMAGGMAGFATLAQAHGYSQSQVRAAQQQLKNDGFYSGTVDGRSGPMTMSAIRNYQRANNLTVTGRLDSQTIDKLGIQNTGQASREAVPPSSPSTSSNVPTPSRDTVMSAQRQLQQSGLYKGSIDGRLGPQTQAAIRQYQQNNNLNVTGQLDQPTMSKLGIS
jgi:peptidoglycan hydrolase-like protein with peptidoglycan-binding domain